MSSIRHRTWELLEAGQSNDLLGRAFDLALASLIVANVSAVIAATVPSVNERWGSALASFEVFSVVVFTVEYLLRLWTSVEHPHRSQLPPFKARLQWMLSPLGLIDLLAILPFYALMFVPIDTRSALILRVFRGLLLLRIFKLARYSTALDVLKTVLRREMHTLMVVAAILFVVLILSAWAMYMLEYGVQPEHFGSVPAAMWWAVVTLSTVGYGDVVPVTALGKFIAGFIAVIGIAIAALPAGILASGFSSEMRRREHSFHRALEQALSDGRISHEDAKDLEKVRQALGLSEEEAVDLRLDALGELRHLTICPHCQKPLRNS